MINRCCSYNWKFCNRFVLSLALGVLVAVPLVSLGESSGGTDDASNSNAALKRDPFWPVGHVPKRRVGVAVKADEKIDRPAMRSDWASAMKKITINGVSSRANNKFCAILNSQMKSVGDTVSVDHEGMIYTWVVVSVKPPKSVKLKRVSAL